MSCLVGVLILLLNKEKQLPSFCFWNHTFITFLLLLHFKRKKFCNFFPFREPVCISLRTNEKFVMLASGFIMENPNRSGLMDPSFIKLITKFQSYMSWVRHEIDHHIKLDIFRIRQWAWNLWYFSVEAIYEKSEAIKTSGPISYELAPNFTPMSWVSD